MEAKDKVGLIRRIRFSLSGGAFSGSFYFSPFLFPTILFAAFPLSLTLSPSLLAVWKNELTALLVACYNGHLGVAKMLVDRGDDIEAKVNNWGTPLMNAGIKGHLAIAKMLVDRGADINARENVSLFKEDEEIRVCSHSAA